MLVDGLQSYLAANAGLTALLGTALNRSDRTTGIFPVMAPSEVPMPYLVMDQIAGDSPADTYQGANAFQSTRWRFSCYGSTYKQAKRVAKALKSALNDMKGALPGPDAKAFVEYTGLKLEADTFEAITRGTLFAAHVDYEINYQDNDV